MLDHIWCEGSSQPWALGPEGGLTAKGARRRPDRPECPGCRLSWRQLGRATQPLAGTPHHTVPMHEAGRRGRRR